MWYICHVKRTKINKKRPGLAHFFNKTVSKQKQFGIRTFKSKVRNSISFHLLRCRCCCWTNKPRGKLMSAAAGEEPSRGGGRGGGKFFWRRSVHALSRGLTARHRMVWSHGHASDDPTLCTLVATEAGSNRMIKAPECSHIEAHSQCDQIKITKFL